MGGRRNGCLSGPSMLVPGTDWWSRCGVDIIVVLRSQNNQANLVVVSDLLV